MTILQPPRADDPEEDLVKDDAKGAVYAGDRGSEAEGEGPLSEVI